MKKRFFIFIAVCVLLTAVWLEVRRPAFGSRYQGKTVDQWFAQYYFTGSFGGKSDDLEHCEAQRALQKMGAPAVQYLVHESTTLRSDTFLTKLAYVVQHAGSGAGYITASNIQNSAEFSIHDIKPPAKDLMPLLTNWVSDPRHKNYNNAIFFLGCVGDGAEAGAPYLGRALHHTNGWTSMLAAQSLMWIGTNSHSALPDIIQAASGPKCSANIYKLLALFGPEARPALPVLLERFETEPSNSILAAVIFCIDTNHVEAFEVAKNTLARAGYSADKGSLTDLLRYIGQAGKPFVPVLIEIARTEEETGEAGALWALQGISPKDAIEVLRSRFKDKDIQRRLGAAGAMLLHDSADAEAIKVLTDFLSDKERDSSRDAYALEKLSNVLPANALTLELLQKFSAAKDPHVSATAQHALQMIRANQKNETDTIGLR